MCYRDHRKYPATVRGSDLGGRLEFPGDCCKHLVIDGNYYESNEGGDLFVWGGSSYNSLEEVRRELRFELCGKEQ